MQFLNATLETQRRNLFLWVPVCFAIGVAIYFALSFEPDLVSICLISAFSILVLKFKKQDSITLNSAINIIILIGLGFGYAAIRSNIVAAPVLEYHYYGAIEGRIIGIDRSASNAPRILLDQIYLPGISPKRTPARIRISLHGIIPDNTLLPGQRVTTTTRISPPSPPAEPGAFDFRRMAWFMKIGAVGYTRNPVIPSAAPNAGGFRIWIFDLRMKIADSIRSEIEGQNGSFAAAIITGDRSQIDPDVMQVLRDSNLAHLLAISGLHMGLLTGVVFAFFRLVLSFVRVTKINTNAKKIAAVLALFIGLCYLALSGANVATQRAFIMVSVVFATNFLQGSRSVLTPINDAPAVT